MFDGTTLASLLTAVGAGTAGVIVTLLVDLWKVGWAKVAPKVAEIDGVFLTIVFSFVLYVLAGASIGVSTLEGFFQVFLSWLFCAASAVGVHKTVVKQITG